MALTRIGKTPDTSVCDCIPPVNTEVTALTEVWETQLPLDPTAKLVPVAVPEAVEATLALGKLRVTHDFVPTAAVYKIVTACGDAILTIRVPEGCVSPCGSAPNIEADVTGQTTTTINLRAPATLGMVTGLPTNAVSVIDKELIVVGEVQNGAYTIELFSECGGCTLSGQVIREVKPVAPPCDPLRFVALEGSTDLIVGQPAGYCYVYSGTGPVVLTGYEGLPLGLMASVETEGEVHKICVSGTVVEDKCSPDDGCRNGKLFVKNCAGAVEVKAQAFVTTPVPRPEFCVGIIRRVSGDEVNGGDFQASFFPPGTKLYVDTVVGECFTATSTTVEYDIATDGTVIFPMPTPTDFAAGACPPLPRRTRVRHDTCAIVSNTLMTHYCWVPNDTCPPP
jgi:hypothetical protein